MINVYLYIWNILKNLTESALRWLIEWSNKSGCETGVFLSH